MAQNLTELEFHGFGLISRNKVTAKFRKNSKQGIRFIYGGETVEADLVNLSSTQRNTVLSKNNSCICLTEHFLAATALCKIDNIDVTLSEAELPFGDGSAQFWLEFFKENNSFLQDTKSDKIKITLKNNLLIKDESNNDAFIEVFPAEYFSITYQLDYPGTILGKQEFTWSIHDNPEEIAKARTFSSEEENKILGLDHLVVGYNKHGFTKELFFDNEAARHKALDLIGDLRLCGKNPLNINMRIISHKGGHSLNSKLTKEIKKILQDA